MAEFTKAYILTIANEGGYSNDPDDKGGETYKGVARNMNSKWDGWTMIDLLKRQSGFPSNLERNEDLKLIVKQFYEVHFWDKIKGDEIKSQDIANSMFDFAVNAGVMTSSLLAQVIVGSKADGVVGNETISKINECDVPFFLSSFTLAKIVRYVRIVKRRPASRKYFYGWICRALGEK